MSGLPDPPAGPLAGRRILVTRARTQAGRLTTELKALGAEVLEIPTIDIVAPDSFDPLDAALGRLDMYQWLLLTSANTVRAIDERRDLLGVRIEAFGHLSVVAIGSATADAARKAGLTVALVPEQYVAESVVAALEEKVQGGRVLLARAALARDVIPAELRRRGAVVDVVDAYRNVVPRESVHALGQAFADAERMPDAATFTSSSTVRHFFELLGESGMTQVPDGVRAISIGPITTATLREHGWEPGAEADASDVDGLVRATVRALARSD